MSPHVVVQGDWGLQSVHHTSLLFLPLKRKDSSHFCAAPAWDLSQAGRESSMNFPSVSPSTGLQFYMNFSRSLSMGCSSSGIDYSILGLQQGHRSCHKQTCSSTNLPRDQSYLWSLIFFTVDPPQTEAGSLIHCGSPWSAGGEQLYHGLHHWLQGNLYSGAWSTSSTSCFTDLGVSRSVPCTLISGCYCCCTPPSDICLSQRP